MSYFEPLEREHMRNVLASTLRAICSQRLIPTTDHKQYALAYEYLARSPAIVKMIRDNMVTQIRRAVEEQGSSDGTTSLNQSLRAMVEANTITPQSAMLVSYAKVALADALGVSADEYV